MHTHNVATFHGKFDTTTTKTVTNDRWMNEWKTQLMTLCLCKTNHHRVKSIELKIVYLQNKPHEKRQNDRA